MICEYKEGNKWRGSLPKAVGLDVQIRVAQPPFQRRRNKKLRAARDILMTKEDALMYDDFPIDYDLRIIKNKDGQIVSKQEQTGLWNVSYVV